MTAWQPIDTAPKDGQRILLSYSYSSIRRTVIGQWDDEIYHPPNKDSPSAGWLIHECEDNYYTFFLRPDLVTHWMSFPDPPKEVP